MNHFFRPILAIGLVCASTAAALASNPIPAADDDQAVLQADRALLQAIGNADKTEVGKLLDADFTWIDSDGNNLTRAQVLEHLPTPANAGVAVQERTYGRSAVVRASRERVHVMRIWARRDSGWRAVLYQEVMQVEKSEPVPAGVSTACENPCKTIPFQPQSPSQKEAIASWQGVMRAMANKDAAAYAPLIADEFVATDTYHDRPYTKADRIAQINKQKQTGAPSLPPALLSARMFDFGDTVMMIAREQRPGANAYFNTRMWVQRDARWQMLFSFNTRIR